MPAGELRARYPVTCPCGHGFDIGPSLAMQMGVNSGHATCSRCRAFLHVELSDAGAAVEPWDVYAATLDLETPCPTEPAPP